MKTQRLAVILVLAALAGCKTYSQQPPSGRMEDVTEAKVTVAAIDAPHRIVTLKDDTGAQFVAEVAPGVQNLDQVKVGDQVIARYSKAVAWQVRAKGQAQPAFSGAAATPSAAEKQPGDKLHATIGQSVVLTGTISNIDLIAGTVTLSWPDGTSDTIKARDPANLKKVKVGDVVDINYTEAVAFSVRPAKSQ
jgi:Cu/Ag efflux protein CusF